LRTPEVVCCLAAPAYMNAIHVSLENDEQVCCRLHDPSSSLEHLNLRIET
jgi:hypothetical protein